MYIQSICQPEYMTIFQDNRQFYDKLCHTFSKKGDISS
jgi:hypothetical protein